jgi:carbon monoxide dehydrogenase subunit G
MKINNEFTVHAPIERAWLVLTDLEGIAPCLPGAMLTGVDGDVYAGKVKIKVGPVISEFAGTAQFKEKDDAAYRAVIDAKGRDARSAGNAAALITAQLRPDGDSTVVTVDTDMRISGKLAQFGSGMIKEVSQKLLAQFVVALEAKIADNEIKTDDTSTATPAPEASTTTATTGPHTSGAAASSPNGSTPAPGTNGSATAPGMSSAATKPGTSGETPAVETEPANTTVAVAIPGGENAAFAVGVTSAGVATTEVAGPAAAVDAGVPVSESGLRPSAPTNIAQPEPEPLDLMSLAGGSIRKRLLPVAIGAAVLVAAVVVYRIVK